MVFGFVGASCNDDDVVITATTTPTTTPTATAFTYTDGDGIAEVKAVPSFSPSSLSVGSTVTVSFPVDSDTTYVQVWIGPYDGSTFNNIYGASGTVAATPGTTSNIPVLVSSALNAVPGTYSAQLFACPGTPCEYGQPGRYYFPQATYIKANSATLSFVETTTVTPPTFTVQ